MHTECVRGEGGGREVEREEEERRGRRRSGKKREVEGWEGKHSIVVATSPDTLNGYALVRRVGRWGAREGLALLTLNMQALKKREERRKEYMYVLVCTVDFQLSLNTDEVHSVQATLVLSASHIPASAVNVIASYPGHAGLGTRL